MISNYFPTDKRFYNYSDSALNECHSERGGGVDVKGSEESLKIKENCIVKIGILRGFAPQNEIIKVLNINKKNINDKKSVR